jgi:hypothetical protein
LCVRRTHLFGKLQRDDIFFRKAIIDRKIFILPLRI